MAREFDVVLFGATGFTGRLVADYLARKAPAGTRIALAGRSKPRLEEIHRGLPEGAKAWPLLIADSSDPTALAALAARTTVVCTTVGPYAKYGLPLVEACANAGTHVCDLTGEVQFMRDSIDRFHAAAVKSGARIVHTCGFDSIPSDLGMWLLHRAHGTLKRVTYVVESLRGGFSGGTVASLVNGVEEATADRARRRIMGDPYALSPDRAKEPDLGNERDLASFRYDDFTARWIAPFVMASINTRVVRRSNALLDYAYGRELRYAEVSGMGNGPAGALRAAGLTAMLGAFMVSLTMPFTKKLVLSRLPQAGEGPSEEARRNGGVRIRFVAETSAGKRVGLLVKGKGDPGYLLTSMLLGESALCLALDGSKLPARAGCLTPATAMGDLLVERLRAGGMTWDLVDG
jgi:short subunit dehydrogenase-like uncharacterized protein